MIWGFFLTMFALDCMRIDPRTMFCLNNVIVQYKNKFYKQTEGIVTVDNHSVSIAYIAMHFVIIPITKTLAKAQIFR